MTMQELSEEVSQLVGKSKARHEVIEFLNGKLPVITQDETKRVVLALCTFVTAKNQEEGARMDEIKRLAEAMK